jgi:hypothetical protein
LQWPLPARAALVMDLGLIRGFDQVQSLLAVADGAARNNEAIIHKPVRGAARGRSLGRRSGYW